MSNAAFVMPGGAIRNGVKMGNITTVDHMICDGLTDAFNNYHMGITAENIAEKYAITREEQDAFAYSSQQKATKSVDTGLFDNEIIPVENIVEAAKEKSIPPDKVEESLEKLRRSGDIFEPKRGFVQRL